MRISAVALACGLLVLSPLKADETLESSFNYFQFHVRTVQGKLDGGTSGDGTEFEFGYDYHGLLFGLRVLKLDYDSAPTSLGPQTHVVGVGTYVVLDNTADFYGRIEHGRYDLDSTQVKLADADMTVMTIGLRRSMGKDGELRFFAGRYAYDTEASSISDVRDQTVYGIRGVLYLSEAGVFGVNAGVEVFDTYRHISFGLTAGF